MKRALLFGALVATIALVAAACGDDDGGTSTGGAPQITSFDIDATTSCTSGENALVAASWSTTGADGVSFSVDGEAVPADAGQPASGSGNIPVPCDGETHSVELTAEGSDGSTAASTKEVRTEPNGGGSATPTPVPEGTPTPTPDAGPVIFTFDVQQEESCTGETASAQMSWSVSENTTVLELYVDDVFSTELEGIPTGSGEATVPCDDQTHRVALAAKDAAGTQASVARTTHPTPEGSSAPVIESFTLNPSDRIACTAGTDATVQASWQTADAEVVSFEVDGQPVPADAGQPLSGTGNFQVPCDNQNHTITITATGANDQSTSQSAEIATSEQ